MSVNACIMPDCTEIISNQEAACPTCFKDIPGPLQIALFEAHRDGNQLASLGHLASVIDCFNDVDEPTTEEFAKWQFQCHIAQERPARMPESNRLWEDAKANQPKIYQGYIARADMILGECPGRANTSQTAQTDKDDNSHPGSITDLG